MSRECWLIKLLKEFGEASRSPKPIYLSGFRNTKRGLYGCQNPTLMNSISMVNLCSSPKYWDNRFWPVPICATVKLKWEGELFAHSWFVARDDLEGLRWTKHAGNPKDQLITFSKHGSLVKRLSDDSELRLHKSSENQPWHFRLVNVYMYV